MVIQHNLSALNAARQYNIVDRSKTKHTEKLSSGYRINRAADDAAGLSISEKLRRQVRGLTKGVENAQDGISLCQVADGALNEVHDMMQRLEELSVQAANGTNTLEDKKAIQKEITQLLAEIDRISSTTTFNEQRVFQGSEGRVAALQPPTSAPTPDTPVAPVAPTAPPIPDVGGTERQFGDFIVRSEAPDTGFDFTDGVLTINTDMKVTIRNEKPAVATQHSIKVAKDINATVVLEGVNISASEKAAFEIEDDSAGNVSVAFLGDNILKSRSTSIFGYGSTGYAGLQKNGGNGTLTIWGADTGSLLAQGTDMGAGIGGGLQQSASHITIHSGNITAIGGEAGIGGGLHGDGSDITINGGIVKASSTRSGAGIGGGQHGNGIDITITGGTVTATGQNGISERGGAGIGGGGYGGYGSNITITGGTVTATGGKDGGAGIGGGFASSKGADPKEADGRNISIHGGTVIATGGFFAAGIGGGCWGNGIDITITGGTVTAAGGCEAAGIGGGDTDYYYGLGGNGRNISITGGIVTATGGDRNAWGEIVKNGGGAGIGGGADTSADYYKRKAGGDGSDISITGGIVTATGGSGAQSIGGGANDSGINLGSVNNTVGADLYTPVGRGTTTIAAAGPAGALVIDDKTGEANGTLPLKQDFSIPDYASVTVKQDAVIEVGSSAHLTNKGTLTNNGTIDVYGKFTKVKGGIESDVPEGRGTLPGTGIVIYHRLGASGGFSSGMGLNPKSWWWIHSGAEPGIGLMVEIDGMDTDVLGLRGMDVTTDRGAANGINAVKGALAYVSDLRSKIGAQQNRLEHTIANENNIVENTQAAESAIRDADVAKEMVSLSMENILAQAGVSVLSQANRDRQGALALLQ